MNIRIERQSEDQLTRESWDFCLIDDCILYLHYYSLQSRPTRRHGWKVECQYNFQNHRDSIHIDKVPKPESVVQEAIQKATSQLRVEWSR